MAKRGDHVTVTPSRPKGAKPWHGYCLGEADDGQHVYVKPYGHRVLSSRPLSVHRSLVSVRCRAMTADLREALQRHGRSEVYVLGVEV